MKMLRLLYMILASIVLLPFILLVAAGWLIFIIYACYKIDKAEEALKVWFEYIRSGIIMNIDFIRNGL